MNMEKEQDSDDTASRRFARTHGSARIVEIVLATQDVDVEAGYADYTDTVDSFEALPYAAKRAVEYGVPPHRLTVTAYFDTQYGRQHDILGTLEEVLYPPNVPGEAQRPGAPPRLEQ
jgi:hypothetical protein